MSLPLYKCHKEVRAAKITHVDGNWAGNRNTLILDAGEDEPVTVGVSSAYMDKHQPKAGGYYVVYESGYESWSPAEDFEAGYSLA